MNFRKIILTASLLSICVVALSQQKGYYSIGKNNKKLKTIDEGKPAPRFVQVQKGYYNIGSNHKKLARSGEKTSRRPKITKGYYSISDNEARLRQDK
jgi:hypothetical protein